MSLLADARHGWQLFRSLRRLARGDGAPTEGMWLIPPQMVAGYDERTGKIDARAGYEELAAQRPPAEAATAARLDLVARGPQYPPIGHRSMQLAYLRNEVVRGAFNLILNAELQAVPELQNDEGKPASGRVAEEFYQLLLSPSGQSSDLTGSDLWRRLYLDELCYGNWLFEKVPGLGTGSRPVRLWRMDPTRTAIMPASLEQQLADPDARIDHYLFRIGGQWFPIPANRVCHWRDWDGFNEFWGVPKLYAAARSLAADSDLVDLLKTTLQNMGVVPHVIEYPLQELVKQIESNKATFIPSNSDLQKVRERWEEHTRGSNRGRAWVAWGYQVKAIALNFEQLAIGSLVATTERRIAMALNVPVLLMNMQGVEGGDQGKNYLEAKEQFYFGPIAARLRQYGDTLSARLAQEFITGGKIVLRTDQMAVFREARARRLVELAKAFQTGAIARHTVYRLAGETAEGPNVFYRRAGTLAIPANQATEPLLEEDALGEP